MTVWSKLATRRRQPEVMDRPDLDRQLHAAALDSLARLNRWSRSAGILWPPIRRLARRLNVNSLSVLDLASGAGDVPLSLWKTAQRGGVELRIDGYDISPCAVECARARGANSPANVQFHERNVLVDPPREPYDVVTCSLFLHHLDDDEAVPLLRTMAAAARHLVLVNDLERSGMNYWLTKAATRLLSRSEVVWIDGPRSVEGAYSLPEMRELAERAGLVDARIERRLPCRFLLTWAADAKGHS